ncbi:paraquat-inducible protein A [Alloalcanivorax mobilis]|uniref:paraquat-inducible protein A n=1 Tax=Alloalcanivorax mobilis TaxID=2019569 RepID=UPI000B5B31D9|nr:paraquat-inducible protein A [Alloalcanivorax mobilis]ASK35592.1 paraquat-inducible protein [Alcanivorax sp. N3-2A]|tara:strand:- start:18818 stop:19324 length:507 start_codon:yes stop_codon:yes gene_type:complete
MTRRAERQLAWALLIAAMIWLVPANTLPIMTLNGIGGQSSGTIADGIKGLFDSGMPGLALVVFTASLLVPFLKVLVLAVIYWHTPEHPAPATAARAYRWVYWIGRWSMLDVFVVALLAGLMRFGEIARVNPEPGITAFGLAVVLTMLSAHAFSPKQLWKDDDAIRANP